MRAFSFVLLALWTSLGPSPAAGQWPGTLEGRLTDAVTGRPVTGAHVVLPGLHLEATTDALGRFTFRAVEPGRHAIEAHHPAYRATASEVEVENGRTTSLQLTLEPTPVPVQPLRARVEASRASGSYGPGAIRLRPEPAGGGQDLADVLSRAPGVTISRRGTGGAATASIRGGGADGVLVLVDGVPLNDPLTGEADLSLLAAASIQEVVVLPGARSARYGPRARSGVVLVETRAGRPRGSASVGIGSLGRVELSAEAGAGARPVDGAGLEWGGRLAAATADGAFDFRRPAETGGGDARRVNADHARLSGTARLSAPLARGTLSVRFLSESVDRGLPGTSYAPSRTARQEEHRTQLGAGWDGSATIPLRISAYGLVRRAHLRDPSPPLGLPWDERIRGVGAGARVEAGEVGILGDVVRLGAGTEVEWQKIRASALDPTASADRIDAGGHVTLTGHVEVAGLPLDLRGALGVDHVGLGGGTFASHEVVLDALPDPALSLHLAHRSGFSPPSLTDQFFRESVGVRANPDLRGERVPSELEAGATLRADRDRSGLSVSADVFRGDVRDMIVWAPDYRFVWSPRNVDVSRRGLDTRAEGRMPLGSGSMVTRVGYSFVRVTYDRPSDEDVQVIYRPRHTAHLSVGWATGGDPGRRPAGVLPPAGGRGDLSVSLTARYTGRRFPVPARVNALPGFWQAELSVGTALHLRGWGVRPSLRVDRLLDSRDSMIFGFPEPGRTLYARVELQPPASGR